MKITVDGTLTDLVSLRWSTVLRSHLGTYRRVSRGELLHPLFVDGDRTMFGDANKNLYEVWTAWLTEWKPCGHRTGTKSGWEVGPMPYVGVCYPWNDPTRTPLRTLVCKLCGLESLTLWSEDQRAHWKR